MDPSNEGEPSNRFAPNERAVNRAISFTSNRIEEVAASDVDPKDATQLGIDFVFYKHQMESLELRKMDASPTVNRNSEGFGKGMYDGTARAVTKTGKILDSLNSEPNLPGLREYLLTEARIIELTTRPLTYRDKIHNEGFNERKKKQLARAEALKKVALAIPDSGVEVERPKIFAWRDPRFNGEQDDQET